MLCSIINEKIQNKFEFCKDWTTDGLRHFWCFPTRVRYEKNLSPFFLETYSAHKKAIPFKLGMGGGGVQEKDLYCLCNIFSLKMLVSPGILPLETLKSCSYWIYEEPLYQRCLSLKHWMKLNSGIHKEKIIEKIISV